MTEIALTENGKEYRAEYEIFDDMLVVYLPDGDIRQTVLNGGIKPHIAAMTHLRSFASTSTRAGV
ncbi:hypothetical protein HH213_17210 [Duganella dendranthematis]|uniref:Uncharacterized protein n=1 Tax=Duganella dendranthematis TaxID=2728021 RepID=A0ABX6MBG7_9BURK|nr:hypothetical protein [Duganella dendranthematis]QJD91671.1 hypothetical protein HH213_17210 [Duganella dendranthematis]